VKAMINNNAILPLVSNLVGQQGNLQTKRNSSDCFFSDFKDMLNSTVDRTYTKQNTKRTYAVASSGKSIEKKEAQRKVKSFSEAISFGQRHLRNNKAVNRKDIDTGYDSKKIKGHSEDEGLKEVLAEVLGVTENELNSLIAALNINPRELMDSANIEAIAQEISDYIGLSSDQQNVLSKILFLIQNEVEHSIGDIKAFSNAIQSTEGSMAKEDWIELEGIDVEVIQETGEIGDKISQISGKVQDALRNSIEPIDIASSQIAVKEENLLAEDEPRDFSDEIEDSDAEDWKESIGDMTSKDNKGFVTKMDYADSNKLGAFSYDVNQKVVQDSQLSQTIQSKIPVTRKEIFTQVIEKAKVLLSGEKSEMVIDLKPDHLGKLALKIATERGIVVAKFVAENEQVKAALESNMNMLKESLEKQGFSVQEFSVFVGDNTERGGYGQNMQHGSHAKSSLKDELPAIGMRDVESLEQLHSEINSYVDGVSSINLTA
jgi:flagellar hook-length control protein FliK